MATTAESRQRQRLPEDDVSEACRERETFRYYPSLLSATQVRLSEDARQRPPSPLVTSGDIILTALAQLAACQTDSPRAFVSLFDASYQHCVAEATPSLPLVPDLQLQSGDEQLWACGVAFPRRQGVVCETCIHSPGEPTRQHEQHGGQNTAEARSLEVLSVPDLTQDGRFTAHPRCDIAPTARFYAAVPIRSRNGVNIGLCAVVDVSPRHDWDHRKAVALSNISRSITAHLENVRPASAFRRSMRMNRGVGSFIEGRSALSGWRHGPYISSFKNLPHGEGELNANQQATDEIEDTRLASSTRRELSTSSAEAISLISPSPISPQQTLSEITTSRASPDSEKSSPTSNWTGKVFSRAANIIRESIEVQGCYFFDAQSRDFGAFTPEVEKQNQSFSRQASMSSEADLSLSSSPSIRPQSPPCPILGFSVTDHSSIDDTAAISPQTTMPDKLMRKLLRRYPHGKIFNFGSLGELLPSDSSGDDRHIASEETQSYQDPSTEDSPRRSIKHLARHREGEAILEAFPGSRSVAFIPIWDSRKDRWYAGAFVYTLTSTRTFTVEGELSYLRAFGMLSMADIIRNETLVADKAKADALSSLSHELRSPLHGVVLGVELLHDTGLSVFQGNILHTIETCSRTLVDTLDHLLDFSKVNNFLHSNRQSKRGSRKTSGRYTPTSNVPKTLLSNVKLDALAEEVIECVFTGFNFRHASITQLSRHRRSMSDKDPDIRRHLDAQHNALDFGPDLTAEGDLRLHFNRVTITLSIEESQKWVFHTQAGAVRRILMNLFGNALKYTTEGMIHISLRQEEPLKQNPRAGRSVVLTVADTGKGISEDYIKNDLFKPFSQEDHLSPGTGLGLSFVKKITSSLGGKVKIESRLGVGTNASVCLPMLPPSKSLSGMGMKSEDEELFEAHISELRGLRVSILGFRKQRYLEQRYQHITGLPKESYHDLMERTCSQWLQMEVLSETQLMDMKPELNLAHEDIFDDLDLSSSQPPCIVVCENALLAYDHTMAHGPHGTEQTNRVFEFVSQPIGPRKLAKVLTLAFNRWLYLQKCPTHPVSNITTGHLNPAPSLVPLEPTMDATQTRMSRTGHIEPSVGEVHLASMRKGSTLEPQVCQLDPGTETGNKFLLVDDNSINLKILVSYSRKLKRDYRTATNGQEALDEYTANPQGFCCIFMDISMPVMDGFEATKRIRNHERKLGVEPITVIALTGLASESAQAEAYGSGIDLFLTKPAKLKEIESILRARDILVDSVQHVGE